MKKSVMTKLRGVTDAEAYEAVRWTCIAAMVSVVMAAIPHGGSSECPPSEGRQSRDGSPYGTVCDNGVRTIDVRPLTGAAE